jgi:hypothetical protein
MMRNAFGVGRHSICYNALMMHPDNLPTPAQRKLLCEMIQRALVHVRTLGWAGKAQQAADLADAFHNIPVEMYNERSFSWAFFRMELKAYESKWGPASKGSYGDYLGLLAEIESSN